MSFVCLNDKEPPMIKEMQEYGQDVYWIYFNQSKRKSSFISAYFQLKKLFKKIKPDIVHTHLFDDGFPGMLAAKHAGVKIRVHTKQSTAFHWYYSRKAIPFDRLLNRTATHLIAVSEECKQFVLEKEKAKPEKVHLIHHGISFDNLKEASSQEIADFKKKFNLEGKTVLGTVCRYIDWKGYKHIIEAFNLIKDKYPDAVFIGVGNGPQEDELRTLIAERGLENRFILTGWIAKKYIPAVYQSLDIYVHAAFMEPFGFVIPEAMINKIPIISTPTGAALDAIQHLENGYLVPYKDVNKLAEGLDYMLSHDVSKFAEQSFELVKEMYGIDHMWRNHLALYHKAISALDG